MLRLICRMLIAATAMVALLAGWLGGCGSRAGDRMMQRPDSATPKMTTTSLPSDQRVSIDNFSFEPRSLTVPAGTTVTWLNRDDVPHTVTSSDSPRKFNSPALDTDEQYSHVFTAPGVYAYFCAVHPKMTGQIVVVAK